MIAGDFDPAEAKRLVEKYFGGLPPGPGARSAAPLDPGARRRARRRGRDRVPAARTYVAYIAPEYFGADEAAIQIAARILGDGLSSRLEKALVYDKPLASEVNVGYDAQEIAGAVVISATARDGVSLADLEKVITRRAAAAGAQPGRRRPSSIGPGPSRSSSSSPGSSASAASAARPIC